MRARRFLLAASALSTLTFCGKDKPQPEQNLPGNPKGTFYDAGVVERYPANPKGTFYDAGMVPSVPVDERDAATPPRDATDAAVRPRDAASTPPGDATTDAAVPRDAAIAVPGDAAVSPRDAAGPPRDAAVRRVPRDARSELYTNPKGSFYDKGLEEDR